MCRVWCLAAEVLLFGASFILGRFNCSQNGVIRKMCRPPLRFLASAASAADDAAAPQLLLFWHAARSQFITNTMKERHKCLPGIQFVPLVRARYAGNKYIHTDDGTHPGRQAGFPASFQSYERPLLFVYVCIPQLKLPCAWHTRENREQWKIRTLSLSFVYHFSSPGIQRGVVVGFDCSSASLPWHFLKYLWVNQLQRGLTRRPTGLPTGYMYV
jgi:hypothetical protein